MSQAPQQYSRRRAGAIMLTALAGLISACSAGNPALEYQRTLEAKMTPEEKAWRARFHDINGYEFVMDAIEPVNGVVVFNEDNRRFTSSSLFSRKSRLRMGNASKYGVPRFYRVTWREGEWQRNNEPRDMSKIAAKGDGTYSGGKVVGDYIVPVAERIPDELLAEMRQRKLGLRIKLRIHPEGVLLGWDLQGPPGTGPQYEKYTMAGGDFREARIYDGKPLRMGWYIHPKTKERIETPF
ncbi:MAG: hypothetical protein Q8J94_07290 [Thiobacillus sp.]|nr:hypothetical protein [Thiobacillus sp.]